MRYLLFALALLASISVVTVPTLSYADPGGGQNAGSGEHNGTHDTNCGHNNGPDFGDDC